MKELRALDKISAATTIQSHFQQCAWELESVKIPAFLPSVSMPKIRAILFDLDNTLIDFIRMKEESCRAAVKSMVASGLQMKEDQVYERLMETNLCRHRI